MQGCIDFPMKMAENKMCTKRTYVNAEAGEMEESS